MQQKRTYPTRQEVQQAAEELHSLMLAMSEEGQKPGFPPEPRHKALAMLTLAVRENIRAFLQVAEHLK